MKTFFLNPLSSKALLSPSKLKNLTTNNKSDADAGVLRLWSAGVSHPIKSINVKHTGFSGLYALRSKRNSKQELMISGEIYLELFSVFFFLPVFPLFNFVFIICFFVKILVAVMFFLCFKSTLLNQITSWIDLPAKVVQTPCPSLLFSALSRTEVLVCTICTWISGICWKNKFESF